MASIKKRKKIKPFSIFLKIVLPCSKPILATVALWLAVGHWNSWYDVLLYVTDSKKICIADHLKKNPAPGSHAVYGCGSDIRSCGCFPGKYGRVKSSNRICGNHTDHVCVSVHSKVFCKGSHGWFTEGLMEDVAGSSTEK